MHIANGFIVNTLAHTHTKCMKKIEKKWCVRRYTYNSYMIIDHIIMRKTAPILRDYSKKKCNF